MNDWLDLQAACALLGVSESTFRRHVLGRLDGGAIDTSRRANRYLAQALVEAHCDWRVEAALSQERRKRQRVPADLGGDADSAAVWADGGDSPALERLRLAKAQMAELDLAVRRKEVLTCASVRDALNVAMDGLRTLIERWERRQRAAEAEEVRDAVRRGMDALSRAIGDAQHTEDMGDDIEGEDAAAGGLAEFGDGAAGGRTAPAETGGVRSGGAGLVGSGADGGMRIGRVSRFASGGAGLVGSGADGAGRLAGGASGKDDVV